MDKFSERIKELRLEKGLTQRELAAAVEISHSTIGYYETNQRMPTAKAIITLAKFFGVTSDYLLGLTDEC